MKQTAADIISPDYTRIDACRACGASGLVDVMELGDTPLADEFIDAIPAVGPDDAFPLTWSFCPCCTLVQLRETVSPERLFDDRYRYFSSWSESWLDHCRRHARELIAARSLGPASLVLEPASNDGYMLRHFHESGIPVLGIDPAPGPASAAQAAGIATRQAFFSAELGEALADQGIRADVVIANNVLAHTPDPRGFLRGVRAVLRDDGVATIEVPSVRELVERGAFDTIYHEHLSYFSVTSAARLMAAAGLVLVDVRPLPTHGGSLRLFVARGGGPSAAVVQMLADERAAGLGEVGYYQALPRRVAELVDNLTRLLHERKSQGRRIAAYGAAAKGTMLLHAAGIGGELLDYVVDRNPHKQGRFIPGVRLPIVAPERLRADPPDDLLILPWNLTAEIVVQNAWFAERGGRFLVPLPECRVL